MASKTSQSSKYKASAEQLTALDELKKRIAHVDGGVDGWKLENDVFLANWLTWHQLNVDKTEATIKKSFGWRKEIGASTKFEGIPEEYFKKFPHYLNFVDKDGNPFLYIAPSRWDVRMELNKHGPNLLNRYLNCWNVTAETVWLNLQLRLGKTPFEPCKRMDAIVNLKDFPVRQLASLAVIDVYIKFAKDTAKNFFPGCGRLVVINMSTLYHMAFSMIKPFLYNLKVNLQVFSCNVIKWRSYLLEFIESDQLHEDFGGQIKLPEGPHPLENN